MLLGGATGYRYLCGYLLYWYLWREVRFIEVCWSWFTDAATRYWSLLKLDYSWKACNIYVSIIVWAPNNKAHYCALIQWCSHHSTCLSISIFCPTLLYRSLIALARTLCGIWCGTPRERSWWWLWVSGCSSTQKLVFWSNSWRKVPLATFTQSRLFELNPKSTNYFIPCTRLRMCYLDHVYWTCSDLM